MTETLGFPKGVYVSRVSRPSPASRAGLDPFFSFPGDEKGDIITAIDGRIIGSIDDMVSYLNSKSPGDEVKLSVYRDSQNVELWLTLDPWPDT